MAQSYLGSEYAFLGSHIRFVTRMLDDIAARVEAISWPPARGAFGDVNIGLYAVRAFDEIDDRRLSNPLCTLDHTLKHL